MSLPVLAYSWFPTTCVYSIQCQTINGTGDPVAVADQVAPQLLTTYAARGVGALMTNGGDGLLFGTVADNLAGGYPSLWHPAGIIAAKTWYDAFFARLLVLGVVLTRVHFDAEGGPSLYSFTDDQRDHIAADPRYAALIAQYNMPSVPSTDYPSWNYGCVAHTQVEMKAGIYDSLASHYPNCKYGNWGDAPLSPADAAVIPDVNANFNLKLPKSTVTCFTPAVYNTLHRIRRAANGTYTNSLADWLPPEDLAYLTPFQTLAYSLKVVYSAIRASNGGPVAPSVCAQGWTSMVMLAEFNDYVVIDVPHNDELRMHCLILSGGDLFHWAGNDAPSQVYVDDDASLTRTCAAYLNLKDTATWQRALRYESLPDDKDVCVISAAQCSDRVIGRVSWAPSASSTQEVMVTVGGATMRVIRTAGEIGTSFVINQASPGITTVSWSPVPGAARYKLYNQTNVIAESFGHSIVSPIAPDRVSAHDHAGGFIRNASIISKL